MIGLTMPNREPPVYEPGADVRLDFVYGYITRSFRIKPDKWKNFLTTEDHKVALMDFFDNPENMFIVINIDSEGFLMPATNFPSVSKTKSVYMMKKNPVSFTIDDPTAFRESIIIGELPPQPLEALMTFVEDVIRPVVTAEVNQDKWPETVMTDLKQQTQEICSVLYTVQGQLRGKTLLPMPVNLEMIEENERRLEQGGPGEVDLQLRTSLETLVIKWSQQINEVLQQDPSKPLKDGHNPTPYVELGFWEDRVQDLKTIYSQLNDDKVRKLANILEKTNSTYWPCFKSMFRNVVAALAEAEDILAHLKPLRRYLDVAQTIEFEQLASQLEALMHCVCLVWGHSRYYCSPARIIDLLQEICNLLITRARRFVDGPSIFQHEPLEGQKRAAQLVDTLQLFRDLYDASKGELPVYFSQESEAKNWDFLPNLVFTRYDKFLGKMKKLKEFFDTSVEFFKLESMDIGGNKGKYLSAFVKDLHAEYTEFYESYSKIDYDCSDPEDTRFEEDYNIFKEKADGIDKRLSAIVIAVIDACDTPESIYKLITTLGDILDRPIVRADFEQQLPLYVAKLDQNFGKIKELYDKIIAPYLVTDRNQIFQQYPPYSASVYWAKGMKELCEEDMAQFRSLELTVEDKESLELLNDKFTELVEILQRLQDDSYQEWKATVEAQAGGWLKEHLFGAEKEDGSLVVNFNHELYATIKEVQYMQLAGYSDIPSTASKIYGEKEIFRKNLSLLDEIAHSYNKILRSANPSEQLVLKGKFKKIDEVLKEAKEKLTWSDSGTDICNYVLKLREPVADMLQRFQTSQDNIAVLKKLILQWVNRPIYERNEGKEEGDKLLCLDSKAKARKDHQYKQIEDCSVKIHQIVEKNKDLLYDSNIPDTAWRSYLNYIDGIVKEGIIRTAAVSIGYLADHTDPTLTPGPLFEIVMELDDSGLIFSPSLEFTQADSFMNLIEDIIQDIFLQGTLIKRIKPGSEDYMHDIETAQSISEMINDINERVQQVLAHTKEYIQRFHEFSHLWEDDKKEYLNQFLKYGRQLTQEEIDAKFAGLEIPEKEPTLDQFREVIDKFEKMYLEVDKFPPESVIDRWFRLNLRPFRQSLLNSCKHWSLLFKQYLIDSVVDGLQNLDKFIQELHGGLTQPLREGDTKTLISVMKWLQKMKERQVATDNMFEPIKEYIELLKTYDYEPPEKTFVQLDQLPIKWNKVKKLAVQVKHQVGPLLVKEVSSIRQRITDFDKTQNEYREKFKESEFFDKESANPYISIDKTHMEIQQMETEYEELCSQAELFEVIVPEPKSLRKCPIELKFAKNIWDCIFIVESCLEDWKTTPWQGIITETMGLELIRLRKDAKAVDIDLKTWAIFTTLESLSKNYN